MSLTAAHQLVVGIQAAAVVHMVARERVQHGLAHRGVPASNSNTVAISRMSTQAPALLPVHPCCTADCASATTAPTADLYGIWGRSIFNFRDRAAHTKKQTTRTETMLMRCTYCPNVSRSNSIASSTESAFCSHSG